MLDILVKHLANVSKHAKRNLMTIANLGVVFGPTLMRPQEETVAAIMDLKFQNIVVEILIENHEKIFKTLPDVAFPEPICMSVSPPNAPPRQSRRQGQRIKRPLAVYNLCLELDDADSHCSPKEDTPTGSMDSLSSQSPTPVFSSSPPGLLDRNHLLLDSGDLADWTTNLPSQSRSSMVSWMNTPCTNPVATNTEPSAFSFPNPVTGSDRAAESIAHRKARAVYPCEAEHSSELSFQTGAIFEDVQFSREPGWLEGTLNGKRGLIPQNYVQFL